MVVDAPKTANRSRVFAEFRSLRRADLIRMREGTRDPVQGLMTSRVVVRSIVR